MGIESRDYFREWMRRRDGRAEPPVAPEHQVKPKPVWPKDNPRGSLPFRRRGTGQHVELAGLREELRHSEAATHAGRTGRGSGPHWLLAAWTLLLAAVPALGGLVAVLT